MRISVKALPVNKVIEDIAGQWNVPIKNESGELSIEVPENLGKGFIRCTNFSLGLGVIEYNCSFKIDYEFLFTLNETHPLKFIFCSEGNAEHAFEEDQDRHTIQTFQNVIVSSSGNYGHMLSFQSNEKAHVTSIEIVREDFIKAKNHTFQGLDPRLKEVFQDSVATKKFFYQGNYSLKSADIVEEINSQEFQGFLRSIYLEAKLYELLVIQIEQYQDDQREDNLPQILRRKDIENVKRASRLILNNLDKNFSVEHLAKEVGTNVNKLQEGFKHQYDLTVNKYVQHVKLEAAKEMLETSEYNISQIVNLIGLNNRSYFSKVFKEKYKVSPKYFLKNANANSVPEEEENEEKDF